MKIQNISLSDVRAEIGELQVPSSSSHPKSKYEVIVTQISRQSSVAAAAITTIQIEFILQIGFARPKYFKTRTSLLLLFPFIRHGHTRAIQHVEPGGEWERRGPGAVWSTHFYL